MSRNSIPVYTDAAYVMEVGPTNSMGELRCFSMRQACSASCYVFFFYWQRLDQMSENPLLMKRLFTRETKVSFLLY